MTLRARLTLWFTGAVAVAMLLYGAFVYVTVDGLLLAQLDRTLHADYERAETMLTHVAGTGATWTPEAAASEGHDDEPPPVVAITGADGRVVHRSEDFTDDGSMRTAEWRHEVRSSRPGAGSETVAIRVARPLAPVRAELRALLGVLLFGLVLCVGITAAGASLLARRALRPVTRMAERAQRITANDLDERLPGADARDEVGRLAAAFNATLQRLEASFDQLRRFTADASHELRTPLTALRAVGEVALRRALDGDECRAVIASMLEESDRLTRLVDDLLTLARADAGELRLAREDTDLGALAHEVADHLAVLAEEKQSKLDVRAQPIVANVDRSAVRRALVNLVANAIQHAPPGSVVQLAVAANADADVLEVTDEGPGIAPQHQSRIFDRFYRIDEARSRQSGGTGLGLAIARAAVEAHGGTIELSSTPGRGSTFRIVLPRRGARAGSGAV